MASFGQSVTNYVNSIPNALKNATADLLANSDFISRSIGMSNSYEDIMFIVQALGREPISLLGKDYLFIFDHVRRNYSMGSNVMNYEYDCPKFTFYKERPTVRFADPYNDTLNLLDRWMPNMDFGRTSERNILYSYAESNDDYTNNKEIPTSYGIDSANPGINMGGISSFANSMSTCDILKKTNDNFNHGKYRTLVARFHTDSMDTKDKNDIMQTAISEKYGMSHGRNLLKTYNITENGYDNPYCRVWTYHHQYNQLARAIRPFGAADTEEDLERLERSGNYNTVGFRTTESKTFGFGGGSKRLDDYGVLNYRNGMVNIAPTAKIKDYFEHKEDKQVSVKKCMFSIENLAWKSENVIHDEYDQYGLSAEQKGPLGGRIMWFPPYDLTFSEDVSVNWNANQFIGRGEKVYTYTDTERRGNLSFTLLIDHPSILDYWTGHERNGMKNQGVSLDEGNTGGVDNINNQENTLLRFFAGCEILSAKPQEFRKRERRGDKKDDVLEVKKENPQETEVHEPSTKKVIHCVLYYPNNYSGVDDTPNKTSQVDAIWYLMNGIGAQKYVDSNKDASDIPTTIDEKVKVNYAGEFGGYEVSKNGISVTKDSLSPYYTMIESTYVDLTTKERKAQRLTSSFGGNGYKATYGSKTYELAKIIGSEAMSLGAAKTSSNLTGASHLWYRKRWYYRIDKAYENQEFSDPLSYLDTASYGLNVKDGYEKLKANERASKAFGIDSSSEKDVTLISFADMFVALEGEKAKNLLSGKYDEKNVELVKSIMNDKDRFNITSIEFEGHASFQGSAVTNNTLSTNRAITFKKWMGLKGFPNVSKATISGEKQNPNNNVDKGENSDLEVKLWRSASVIIEYEEGKVEDAATAEKPTENVDRVEVNNNTSSNPITPPSVMKNVKNDDSWLSEHQNNMTRLSDDLNTRAYYEYLSKKNGKNYFDEMSWDFDSSYLGDATNVASVKNGVVERYDNEGEFFKLLEKNDPFMHNLITDKIKYFDPAFHSISPEGFNARLTVLHQCTRQGSTVGSSDRAPGTAYNLAFGRPPVCVLRLGDFYYTKVIINSVSIQYEQPQWDLNPEGIGVMPMFAKVTLSFVFLGGSDLAGPISRLQNAVSFNYYANTSVYDNRAEMVQYDADGNGREVKFKPFSYPDMLHTNGEPPKKLKGSASFSNVALTDVNGDENNKWVDKETLKGKDYQIK